MLDYLKLWIYNTSLIEKILNNQRIQKDFISKEDGTLKGIKAKFENWKIQTLSPSLLEITGSIHKYWNNGSNENDFSFLNAIEAIRKFCIEFELTPSLVFVKNLEFGVNLQLKINASEVIDQVLCFNNLQPIRPYNYKPDCYFLEFEQWEYYLKMYDKGKQYRKMRPSTPNTLRIELKAMNSRYLNGLGIETLEDLLQPSKLQVLGLKFDKTIKGLVFDDDSINAKELPLKDRRLYKELNNPRKWKLFRSNTNSTIRNKVNRFKLMVDHYGKRKIYSTISGAVKDKLNQLSQIGEMANFLSNTYTRKNDKKRLCLSCGREISDQKQNSLFCSAKYVGEKEAKRCRNKDSNPRNNMERKLNKINKRGVLFDIGPFMVQATKMKIP